MTYSDQYQCESLILSEMGGKGNIFKGEILAF